MRKNLAPLLAVFLCSSCGISNPGISSSTEVSSSNNRESILLGYYVPPIPNWGGAVFTRPGSTVNSVTYKKNFGSTKAVLRFSVSPPMPNSAPDDISKLNKVEDESLQIMRKMDSTTKILRRKASTFKGHPAVLTIVSTKNTQSTAMRIADGKNTLLLSKSFVGLPVPQQAEQETEAAWKSLLEGIRFPGGSSK